MNIAPYCQPPSQELRREVGLFQLMPWWRIDLLKILLLQLALVSKLCKRIANIIGQPMARSHTIFESSSFFCSDFRFRSIPTIGKMASARM